MRELLPGTLKFLFFLPICAQPKMSWSLDTTSVKIWLPSFRFVEILSDSSRKESACNAED